MSSPTYFAGMFFGKGVKSYRRRWISTVAARTGIVYDDGAGGFIAQQNTTPDFGLSNTPGYNERTSGSACFATGNAIATTATITFAKFSWRTGTILTSGTVLTVGVDVACWARPTSAGNLGAGDFGSGTVISSGIAQASATNYSYTFAAGDYAYIGKGVANDTAIELIDHSSLLGVPGMDSVYVPVVGVGANRFALEIYWTIP